LSIRLANRIPCKYLVVKYVEDVDRDEPINIGIILQSKKNNQIYPKFISDFHKLRSRVENTSLVKILAESTIDEIKRTRGDNALQLIAKKYSGKLKFTEYRGTLAKSLEEEAASLYKRFVSIEEVIERTKIITLPYIRKNVWNFVNNQKNVRHNHPISGQRSKFVYDFVFGQNKKILHSISFDAQDSLKKTKLFDWHVMDAVSADSLTIHNFGAIISEPTKKNPKYEKVNAQFKEGVSILQSKDYDLIYFDETEKWKKEIRHIAA